MATSGDNRSPRMKIGAKKVAPPTPEAMAVVATRMATGNMNQYSKLMALALFKVGGTGGPLTRSRAHMVALDLQLCTFSWIEEVQPISHSRCFEI